MTCEVCQRRFRLWFRLEAHWQKEHSDYCRFCFYRADECQCHTPDWRD